MADWNKTQEHFLQVLGENAKSLDWLHGKSSLGLTWWSKWFSISSIFFNAVLTTLSASDLWGNPILFNFVVLGVSIVATALVGTVKSLNYPERIENHRQAGHKFKTFANEVTAELALRRKDRGNAEDLVKEFVDKFDKLLIGCPNVEEKIIFKFNEKFEKSDFSKPALADEITGIEIKEESNNSSKKSNNDEDEDLPIEIDTSLQDDLESALENKD